MTDHMQELQRLVRKQANTAQRFNALVDEMESADRTGGLGRHALLDIYDKAVDLAIEAARLTSQKVGLIEAMGSLIDDATRKRFEDEAEAADLNVMKMEAARDRVYDARRSDEY